MNRIPSSPAWVIRKNVSLTVSHRRGVAQSAFFLFLSLSLSLYLRLRRYSFPFWRTLWYFSTVSLFPFHSLSPTRLRERLMMVLQWCRHLYQTVSVYYRFIPFRCVLYIWRERSNREVILTLWPLYYITSNATNNVCHTQFVFGWNWITTLRFIYTLRWFWWLDLTAALHIEVKKQQFFDSI